MSCWLINLSPMSCKSYPSIIHLEIDWVRRDATSISQTFQAKSWRGRETAAWAWSCSPRRGIEARRCAQNVLAATSIRGKCQVKTLVILSTLHNCINDYFTAFIPAFPQAFGLDWRKEISRAWVYSYYQLLYKVNMPGSPEKSSRNSGKKSGARL